MTNTVVQAQYAELEAIARRFAQEEARVQEVARSVVQRADVLRGGAWEGHGREAFLAEIDGELRPALQRLAAALCDAGRVTTQMRAVLEAAEREAAALFATNRATAVAQTGGADGVTVADGPPDLGGSTPADTNLEEWSLRLAASYLGMAPVLFKTLDWIGILSEYRRAFSRPALLTLGRLLNVLTRSIGKVTETDDMYRTLIVKGLPFHGETAKFLRSARFGGYLAFADALITAHEDFQRRAYNGDVGKILVVNGVSGLVNFGVGLTGYGTVALVLNEINQQLGSVESGAMRWGAEKFAVDAAMQQRLMRDADSIAAAHKKVDLQNINRELGEAVNDGYRELLSPHFVMGQKYWEGIQKVQRDPSFATLNQTCQEISQYQRENAPALISSGLKLTVGLSALVTTDAGRSNLMDMAKATGNVLDGAVDSAAIRVHYAVNMAANASLHYANSVPASNGSGAIARSFARGIADFSDAAANRTVGLVDMKVTSPTGDPNHE
jgi:WXG100 family type VII secretion target